MKIKLISSTLLVCSVLAGPAFAERSVLYFNSQPEDGAGQGIEVFLTEEQVDFYPWLVSDRSALGFTIDNFSRPDQTEFMRWNADFRAPFGTELVEGIYENAVFLGNPGLNFSGTGWNCLTETGRFEVLEAVYDPATNTLVSFAVDFEQHCNTSIITIPPPPDPIPTSPLFGSIRFNSDIPVPIILSARIALVTPVNSGNCVEATDPDGATVSLAGSAATENPVELRWSASGGQTGFGPEFSVQLGVDETVEVTLTVEDLVNGDQASSSLNVCVSDRTAPTVTILAPADGDVFAGENAVLSVQVSDLVDRNITSYRRIVGQTGTAALDSRTGTGRTMLFRKIPGEPERIDIVAEAEDFSGNVGSAAITVYRSHGNSAD